MDRRYLDERERFALRATCEWCQHFSRIGEDCSLGFPEAPHREATHQQAQPGQPILFCKYFEID